MAKSTTPMDTSVLDERLEVTRLGEDDWRVCDGRLHPLEPLRIIAYVQRHPDFIEVLWMHNRRELEQFAGVDDAFAAVAQTL